MPVQNRCIHSLWWCTCAVGQEIRGGYINDGFLKITVKHEWRTINYFYLHEWLQQCKQKIKHVQYPKVGLLPVRLHYLGSRTCVFVFSRFKKAFESEPTLQSGINYAVLLLAAGYQFDSSFELRKVGNYDFVSQSNQIQVKMTLPSMQ